MSFDLQVNGYGGADFNSDSLSPEALHDACAHLESDGVGGFLLTLITDDLSALEARLRRLVALRENDQLARRLIVGFHLEGPFLNPNIGFRGAHPEQLIIPSSVETAKRLMDASDGLLRLVTLAPEHDANFATTRFLSDSGIRVAAGHCDPSLEQLQGAIDAGLSLWTHLGNGCPISVNRHDNVIQRALSLSDQLWLCFIADGAHVPFFALKNYLRAASLERCIIVTDAIAPAGLGPGRYTLGHLQLDIGPDMVARAPDSAGGSYLAGAAITMPQSIANLREHLHLSPAQLVLLTNDNPRRALGL
ncbi:N-acetylgalactosamine-6-phosphate deacetylase [Abditibacteriota bacterium]|nr:N-acetylgalactosamine-6-phosphate deacetylase [Abditibacteriota bacterium]